MSTCLFRIGTTARTALLTGLLMVGFKATVGAAEITFLCAAALRPAMTALIAEFEAASGHHVVVSYSNIAVVSDRIRSGTGADLVTISPQQWETLQKEGKLSSTRVVIAKIGVGVLVKKGAPKPDVSSSEAVKRALIE